MRSSSYICDCQNVDCNTIPEMEKKCISLWLSCVVLKQGCCGSVTWIFGQKKNCIQVLQNVGIVQTF